MKSLVSMHSEKERGPMMDSEELQCLQGGGFLGTGWVGSTERGY